MSIDNRFQCQLQQCLPKLKLPFDLVHLKTNPKKCRKLVYQPKQRTASLLDMSSTHFFILSYKDLAFFALEIILYESPTVMTLFISKADTSGHYYETEVGASVSIFDITVALLKSILHYYIKPSKLLRICLFGKAEGQYLFPLSSENKHKHLLSDSALIKWWLRVLDKLSNDFKTVNRATLQIPGSDKPSIEAFFPKPSSNGLRWSVGDIFRDESDLVRSKKRIGAVYYIPRFPDDPKGRFLDYLVLEKRAKKTSVDQFFLELQSRQEFRLGSVVGIIGVEGYINDNADTYNIASSTPHSISYKEFNDLKDVLMSSSFATRELAESSTAELFDRLSDVSKLQIFGQLQPTLKEKKSSIASSSVNVLGSMLIRKKPKQK